MKVISFIFLTISAFDLKTVVADKNGDYGLSTKNWMRAKCQNQPIDMISLPKGEPYFGAVAELVHSKGFGTVLYFRSDLEDCSYVFGVPLPFQARAISFYDGLFYVLKEEEKGFNGGNLHILRDYNLIGGFVYWLNAAKKQRDSCAETPVALFNYTNTNTELDSNVTRFREKLHPWLNNGTTEESEPEICEVVIRHNHLIGRIEISTENLLYFGNQLYRSLRDRFLATVTTKTEEQRIRIWQSWPIVNHVDGPQNYVTISRFPGGGTFACTTYKNELYYASLTGLDWSATDGNRNALVLTTFRVQVDYTLIIDMAGKLTYVTDRETVQVGYTKDIERMSVVDEIKLVAMDSKGEVYVSHTIIPDIFYNFGGCRNGTLLAGSRCKTAVYYHDELYDPKEVCAAFEKGLTPQNGSVPNRWLGWDYFDGKYEYFVSTEFMKVSDAAARCRQYNSDLVHIDSRRKQSEIARMLKQKIESGPQDFRIYGTSDFVFWIKLYNNTYFWDPTEECCNLPDEEAVDCGSPGIMLSSCVAMGCCFDDVSETKPYCYYPNGTCTSGFEFLAETTLYSTEAEVMTTTERPAAGNQHYLAIVHNPLLGIDFVHRTYDGLHKFNFICERVHDGIQLPRQWIALPNDYPIIAECIDDMNVTYTVPFGSEGPINCSTTCADGAENCSVEHNNTDDYNMTFVNSTSEETKSCQNTVVRVLEDCEVRTNEERVKCHIWHEYITKEECIAHGCCFDTFMNPASEYIQCFARRDAGYISGPYVHPGRKRNVILCTKPKLSACEVSSHLCHANANCVDDDSAEDKFQCYCNEGFIGDGRVCWRFPSCPPGWTFLDPPFSCLIMHSFGMYALTHSITEAETVCNSMGARLFSKRSFFKLASYEDIFTELGNPTHWLAVGIRMYTAKGYVSPEQIHPIFNRSTLHVRPGYALQLCQVRDRMGYNVDTICNYQFNQALCEKEKDDMHQRLVCIDEDGLELYAAPEHLFVEITSQPRDSRTAGYEKIIVQGLAPLFKYSTKSTGSCFLLMAIDRFADVISASKMCDSDGFAAADSEISKFVYEVLPEAEYFGVTTSGFLDYKILSSLSQHLRTIDPLAEFPLPEEEDHIFQKDETIVEVGYYEEGEGEILFHCQCEKDIVENGVKCVGSMILVENGKRRCKTFYDAPTNDTKTKVTLIQQSPRYVSVRLQVVELINIADSAQLSCPYPSYIPAAMGVNATLNLDVEAQILTGSCNTTPCILQLACPQIQPGPGNQSPPHGMMLFCRKFPSDIWMCPIRKQPSVYEGFVTRAAVVENPGDPVFLDMGDLLNLGATSMSYEILLENSTEFKWRPLEWEWMNDEYAHVVGVGVMGRALRFFGQEARTHGDPCWGLLGDAEECPHGITASFWIFIMDFPQYSFLRILDTGVWDMDGECGGMTVFVDPGDNFLHIAVVQPGSQMWRVYSTIRLRKWTHILMSWSKVEGLSVTIDKGVTLTQLFHERKLSTFNPADGSNVTNITCETSTLRIGHYAKKLYRDGSFQIDELHIFSEWLGKGLAYKIMESQFQLPVRHFLPTDEISFGSDTSGDICTIGLPEDQHEQVLEIFEEVAKRGSPSQDVSSCYKFINGCLGSPILCQNGFTIGFTVKINGYIPEARRRTFTEDVVMSNLPSTPHASLGFSILISYNDIITGNGLLKLNVQMDESMVAVKMNEWTITPDEWHTILVQMTPEGTWRVCLNWPTECKVLSEKTIGPRSVPDSLKDFVDFYDELNIGPMIVTQNDFFVVRNLKAIEEDLDLVVVFDEFNEVPNPEYWPLPGVILTTSEELFPFVIKGEQNRIIYDEKKFPPIELNNSDLFSTEPYVWLELPYQELYGLQCIADIDNCTDGFTLQLWLQAASCSAVESSSKTCVFLASMHDISQSFKGFAIYQSAENQIIYVLVQTTNYRWKVQFTVDPDVSVLLRFSWHPVKGLSMFINDVLRMRTTYKKDISRWPKKSIWPSLMVGGVKANNKSCSTMRIADLYYWNTLVEGYPFLELEHFCPPGMTQIGESCYWYKPEPMELDTTAAEMKCRESGGIFPTTPTFAQHLGLKKLIQSYMDLHGVVYIWTGLHYRATDNEAGFLWAEIGVEIAETGFSNKAEFNGVLTRWYGKISSAWFSVQMTNDDYVTGLGCERQIMRDPFYLGCVDPVHLDLNSGSYLEVHSEMSTNTHGTYNFPHACLTSCWLKMTSSVIAVSNGSCFCFDRSIEKDTSLPFTSRWLCKNFLNGGKMSVGTIGSVFKEEIHPDHCGPIQMGGALKCGGTKSVYSDGLHMSVYAQDSIQEIHNRLLSSFQFGPHNENSKYDTVYETEEMIIIKFYKFQCFRETDNEADSSLNCDHVSVRISIEFDDGTDDEIEVNSTKEAEATKFRHYYDSPGLYTILVNITQLGEGIVLTHTVTLEIQQRPELVHLSHLHIPIGLPEAFIQIETFGLSGDQLNCRWSFGDGSPAQTSAVASVPIPAVKHRFSLPGDYLCEVFCWNRISQAKVSAMAHVRQPINLLEASTSIVVNLEPEKISHRWRVYGGSHIKCKVTFANQTIPEKSAASESTSYFEFDPEGGQGEVTLSRDLYYEPGFPFIPGDYIISIMCYNEITDPVPITLTYLTVEKSIHSFSANIVGDKRFILPGEEITILSFIEGGSNVHLAWEFGEDPEQNIYEFCPENECPARRAVISYLRGGEYYITVSAANSVSSWNETFQITVEIEIESFSIKILNVSMASIPVEVILVHPASVPKFPTPGVVELNFGTESVELDLVFDEITGELHYFHRYIGVYNITAHAYNNVSSYNSESIVQVGEDIFELEIKLMSKRYLRTDLDLAVLHVTLQKGSEVTYTIYYGDEDISEEPPFIFHENVTRINSTVEDLNVHPHSYSQPGNYSCRVIAENLFGSAETRLSERIIVQNPLDQDVVLSLKPIATVAFPPGIATFDAELIFVGNAEEFLPRSALNGYASNVKIKWYRGSVLLAEGYGLHELDLFPQILTLTRESIGDVIVTAQLWNLVSFVQHSYQFHMSEKIGDVMVTVVSASPDATLFQHPNGTFLVDLPVNEQIQFKVTAVTGSHVRYNIQYGDGSNSTLKSPTLFATDSIVKFEHIYEKPGAYDVQILAQNDISKENHTFFQSVRVYQRILRVTLQEFYVDKDDYDFLTDDEDFLSLKEKKSAHKFMSKIFYPLQKTIVLQALISGGSNATFTWKLPEAGIFVQRTKDKDHFKVINATSHESWLVDGIYTNETLTVGIKKTAYQQSPRKSVLYVKYKNPGRYTVGVEVSNKVGSKQKSISFFVEKEVGELTFEFEPPLANLTSNMTFGIDQVGTDQCFVLNWGDGTELVAFGLVGEYCLSDKRIIKDIYSPLTEHVDRIYAKGTQWTTIKWSQAATRNVSDAALEITVSHTYEYEGVYQAEVIAFNRASESNIQKSVIVIKVLCDYPRISIDKPDWNSRKRPREVLKSLKFKIYSTIRTRCLITNIFETSWSAYREVKEVEGTSTDVKTSFQDTGQKKIHEHVKDQYVIEGHVYQYIPGLFYTPRSEVISIPPRFLHYGLYVICLNVVMVDVAGIDSTDCLYILVKPTPLVAAVLFGNARTVGNDEVFTVTGTGASYDPDVVDLQNVEDFSSLGSNLFFLWSSIFLANTSTADFLNGGIQDQIDIVFGNVPGYEETSICLQETVDLSCTNMATSLHFYNATLFNDTNGEDCGPLVQKCLTKQIIQTLKQQCEGKTSCSLRFGESWDMDESSGDGSSSGDGYSGSGLESSQLGTLLDCVRFRYQCNLPEAEYLHYKSNSPCISSGYYTKEQQYLKGVSAFDLTDVNTTSCSTLKVDAGELTNNASYIILLKVREPMTKREALSYQIFEVSEGGPPTLRILCIVNCKARVNSFKLLSFQARCTSCKQQIDVQYSWTLFVQTGENRTFIPVENLKNYTLTGENLPALVLQPQSLIPGAKYRFQVIGKQVGHRLGMTLHEVIVNLPPFGGDCDIKPVTGNCLNQTFTVRCWGWKDEGVDVEGKSADDSVTLKYEIWYQKQTGVQPYLLSSGNNPVVQDKYMTPGVAEEGYWVSIYVYVVDEFGDKAEVMLRARVYEEAVSLDELLLNLTESTISSSGAQATSEFSQVAAEIMNTQVGHESNNSSGDVENDVEQKKQQRISMRSQLVKAVTEKSSYKNNLEGVQQAGSALKSLMAAPNEVKNDTQLLAINALSNMTDSLAGISNIEAPEDIEGTASDLVNALDLVVDAAREQVLSAVSTAPGKESIQYSLPPKSTASGKTILDVEEEFLSPKERLEYREMQQQRKSEIHAMNREQIKQVGSKAVGSVFGLASAVMQQRQPGEPSVKLQAKDMKIEIERKTAADICKSNNTSKGFQLPCGSNFLDGLNEDDIIDVEMVVNTKNPYIWDDSADDINSDIISLNLNLPSNMKINSTNPSSPFRIEIPVKPSSAVPERHMFVPSGIDNMSYHELELKKPESVIFMTIIPDSPLPVRLRLYFQVSRSLADPFPNTVNNSLVIDMDNAIENPNFPNRIRLDVNSLGTTGHFVLGIHEIGDSGSVVGFENMTWENYTMHTFITSCRYWNEELEKWDTEGCTVSSETSESKVVCLCDHLTSFGADFFVAPNPIDFAVIAKNIGNLANNLAVLLTLIVIFCLYVAGLVFCRRKDKQDVDKWSVAPLLDNQLINQHFYQITIKTGNWNNSGTKSKVYFVIGGQENDTVVRHLATREKMKFEKGSVTKVIMSTLESLGDLSYIRIWHDNSGGGNWASWHLETVLITDLQTNKKFYFICDDWLAVDESDGSIDRVMVSAGKDEIQSFKNLFSASARQNLNDGHLWFSLFSRPTKSNFTRVQRLTCAITLLFCTMLTSAMFFGREADNSDKQGRLEIGPITFTMQQLMVSIQSSVIVLPINILIVQIFRRVAPRGRKSVKIPEKARNMLSAISLHHVIENERKEEVKSAKLENKKFMLPHWCIFIAWSVSILTSLGCAGVVFLYSIMWGPEKSIDWLTSIIMSFGQSVFVIQPVKVVVVAILFSVFIRRIADSKAQEAVDAVMEDEGDDGNKVEDIKIMMNEQEDWLLRFPDDGLDDDEITKMLPPEPDKLEEARQEMLKRKRMISTAYEIASYLFYVLLLLVASNAAKDPMAFQFHQSLTKVFVDEGEPQFSDVRTFGDFWDWCDSGLVDGLFASNWYNGKRAKWSESRFISNRESFVLGPARLRQIRVNKDPCKVLGATKKIASQCSLEYSFTNEDTNDYRSFWRSVATLDKNETDPPDAWTYQSFIDLGGMPYEGRLNVYSGGGYAVTLGNTAKRSREIINELKLLDWIDHYTRAIFVEFTVYNANINLFGSLILLLERSENGAFAPFYDINSIRLYEFIDGKGYTLLAVYIIFLAVLIYKCYRVIKHIKTQKCRYFKNFWNAIDIVTCILSLILIGLYAARYVQARYTLNKVSADIDKETFVNFQYIAMWNNTFRFMLAFIVFFSVVRFIRLLRFNKRILLLAHMLKIAAPPLLAFYCMFALYFTSFLFLAWIWFEQKIHAFRTIISAAEEMIVMMLGRFDFTEMQQADRLLGPIFFTTFTFACTIALMNMFVVILDESIKKARREDEDAANEFELVDYITKKIKKAILQKIPTRFLGSPGAKYKVENEEEDEPFASQEYIPYPEDVLLRRLDTIAERVARLEEDYDLEETLPTIDELEAELDQIGEDSSVW